MENEMQKAGRIYLKPNAFDLVLDVINGLFVLALWGIALGSFVFPESYPIRFDRSSAIISAAAITLISVLYYRVTRYPIPAKYNFFLRITEENVEWQYRLNARALRMFFLWFALTFLMMRFTRISPTEDFLEDVYFPISMGFLICMLIWHSIRAWMLR
ncbi:MAG: hypothetical protein FWC50_08970 [Planctomycetaceae bacterium]|nr:hypothetical protein [Planctomycetaceae bacterium]